MLVRDRIGRGETVGLRFEPSGCHVFPSPEGPPPVAPPLPGTLSEVTP